MSIDTILILCGPDGPSAEADVRIHRLAQQDDLPIRIEKLSMTEDWSRSITRLCQDCGALVISPDASQVSLNADRESLYRTLVEVSQRGVLLAEVHEDNIFRTDNELTPLQPSGCHIRLVCGLGAVGYLLAIEALIRARSLQ